MALCGVDGSTMRRGLIIFVPLLLFNDDLAFFLIVIAPLDVCLIIFLIILRAIIIKSALEAKLGIGINIAKFDGIAMVCPSSGTRTTRGSKACGDGNGKGTCGGASGCAFIIFDECG